jgi:hypothetical protein
MVTLELHVNKTLKAYDQDTIKAELPKSVSQQCPLQQFCLVVRAASTVCCGA